MVNLGLLIYVYLWLISIIIKSYSPYSPHRRLDYIVSSAILMKLASLSLEAVFAMHLITLGLSSASLYHSHYRQFSSIFQTIELMILVLPVG